MVLLINPYQGLSVWSKMLHPQLIYFYSLKLSLLLFSLFFPHYNLSIPCVIRTIPQFFCIRVKMCKHTQTHTIAHNHTQSHTITHTYTHTHKHTHANTHTQSHKLNETECACKFNDGCYIHCLPLFSWTRKKVQVILIHRKFRIDSLLL
jgi:hypothetical protein